MLINELLKKAAVDLHWPARTGLHYKNKQDVLNKYVEEYKKIKEAGIISNDLLTCWDDWDLYKNDWHENAPFIFKNNIFLNNVVQIYIAVDKIFRSQNIKAHGVSELIYRTFPRKCIVKIEGKAIDNNFTFKIDQNGEKLTVFVPSGKFNTDAAIQKTDDTIIIPRSDIRSIASSRNRSKTESYNSISFKDFKFQFNLTGTNNNLLDVASYLFKLETNLLDEDQINSVNIFLYITWISFCIIKINCKNVYYVPARGFIDLTRKITKGIKEECSGGVYIWCDETTKVDLEALQAYQTYRGLRTSVGDFAKREERKVKELALKNAMSVIMSRNLSHNISSHVMPRTEPSQVFRRIKEFYTDGPYHPPDIYIYSMMKNIQAKLHRYIQYKSDFLAEITTEPGASTRKARFFADVMANFLGNTLLLDNIAAMEGLGYKNKWSDCKNLSPSPNEPSLYPETTLRVDCFFDGKAKFKPIFETKTRTNIEYENVYVPLGWRDIHAYGEDLTFTKLQEDSPRDPIISLPGPLGEFALYGFLENFIRNTAKHNQELIKKNGNILTIELGIKKDVKHPHDYYLLKITSDTYDTYQKVKVLLENLKKLLKKDLITDDHSPRTEGWGIAEMMICANLLAGKDELYKYHEREQNDEEKSLPPLTINAEKKHRNPKKGRIIYTLCIMKPKQAIFFGKFENLNQRFSKRIKPIKNDTEWKEKGILAFNSLEEFAKEIRDGTIVAPSFDFAILDKEQENKLPNYIHLLPFRIIIVTKNGKAKRAKEGIYIPNNKIELENGPDRFIEDIWEHWLRTRWPDGVSTLALYLGPNNNAWAEKSKNLSSFSVQLNGERNMTKSAGKTVLFDRHGLLLPGTKEEQKNIASYIVFDKNSADFSQIFQPPSSEPWLFPYELLEAGLLKVLILDERIVENAMQPFADQKIATFLTGQIDQQPLFWHLAFRSNVFIATHVKYANEDKSELIVHDQSYKKQADLFLQDVRNNQLFRTSCPKLTVDISKETEILIYDCNRPQDVSLTEIDMLIIHQGVLDRLHKTGLASPEKLLENFKKNIPWVIVESGRGIPPEIQKTMDKFLPFSALDHCLKGIRVAKLSLAQRTMTLTRKK